ncbi:MAG: hypothetical protein AAFX93_03005 [Verrucomicrobiota bacterium]
MPHIIHTTTIIYLGVLPLWSGGWGLLDAESALKSTLLIVVLSVAAILVNEYLVKVSDLDWEHFEGRWRVVVPVAATLAGVNVLGPEDLSSRVALTIGSGLAGLTALRTQTHTDILMRMGLVLAAVASMWGIGREAFTLALPLVLLLALQFAYDPPEPRSYLSLGDHANLVVAILMMGAALLSLWVLIGMGLSALGVEFFAAATEEAQENVRAEAKRHKIDWLDFVLLAALLYFGLPYILKFLSRDKAEEGEATFEESPSVAHRIAEQFRRKLARKTPRDRVIFAFNEMLKDLVKLGYVHEIDQTPERIGKYLCATREIDESICHSINVLFYRACYTEHEITEADVQTIEYHARQVLEAYRL